MVVDSIVNNISGLQIISQLNKTSNRVSSNLERIASGLRINKPSDDAGGFVLSNKLYSQYRGLSQASENTQNAISLVNTAQGAVGEMINILNDIRTAAVAASGGDATQQLVILEKLDALNSIAQTTRYGRHYLLNGAQTTNVGFKSGTRNFGASLAFGPDATTLFEGRSYLKLGLTNEGTAQIQNGGDATFNTGISNLTDIAVSTGQFVTGGIASVVGDTLAGSFSNTVSIVSGDYFTFSGFLADGVTHFSGSLSLDSATTVQDLVSSIQVAIDAYEQSIGVDGTGSLETTVAIDGNGRLRFHSGTSQDISDFEIDLRLYNNADQTKTAFTSSRESTMYDQITQTTAATGAKIGNHVSSVTGSTFDSGSFTITVANVVASQTQQVQTSDQFERNPGGVPALLTTNLNDSLLNGIAINDADTFQINGTNPDGSTFTSTYTVGIDTGVGDGIIEDYQSLIDELNNRNQTLTTSGYTGATASLNNGFIQLDDDVAGTSSTDIQILVSAGGQTVNSTINTTGSEETATVSINGGPTAQVYAGEITTLQGINPGGPTPEVTFRMGSGFTAGDDLLVTTAKEFVGSLNGGSEVTFQNGDTDVTFTSGEFSIYPIKKFQQVTLDFDAILDVTSLANSGGETFVISTTSNKVNFQIGSDGDGIKSFLFADLTSDNLGSNASNTLDDIDVTTASGATAALDIIDDALDQVNNFAARLGAFSSRLDDTVSALDAASLNIESGYTQIVSADIATETTELTLNSLLLQAQSAVLVQANSLPQAVLSILLDLD
jgi:flagellin